MLLKNKKTGEIAEPFGITCKNGRTFVRFDDGKGTFKFEARSLSELNEEWEDYEEPKVGYIIDPMEEDYVSADDSGYEESDVERAKELGIWLETKEEAEKAVLKLKAWKRLKDKGFRFDGYGHTDEREIEIVANWGADEDIKQDLLLLFGGE